MDLVEQVAQLAAALEVERAQRAAELEILQDGVDSWDAGSPLELRQAADVVLGLPEVHVATPKILEAARGQLRRRGDH